MQGPRSPTVAENRFKSLPQPLLTGILPLVSNAPHIETGTHADPTSGSTDEGAHALVEAIAAGDTAAFAVFYERWFDRGLDLTAALTRRDESFCLDVVQDAMLRAARSLGPRQKIRGYDDLDRWMIRVLHTTALDRLRADARRTRREQHAARGREETPDATHTETGAAQERIAWIRARLDDLSATERELVVARFGRDRTLEQAAAGAGMTGGAGVGKMTRLLKRLRHAAQEVFLDR